MSKETITGPKVKPPELATNKGWLVPRVTHTLTKLKSPKVKAAASVFAVALASHTVFSTFTHGYDLAVMLLTGAGGKVVSGGGPAYSGPGDLGLSATPTAFWGLRAYTSALRGSKVANVCDITGGTVGTCADFNSDASTGIIETKAVGGVTCPSSGGTNCGVAVLYDRTGTNNCAGAPCDAFQYGGASASTMPTLASNCSGISKPCMLFNGSQKLDGGPNFPNTTLPRTISYVGHRTASFTSLLAFYNGQTAMECAFGNAVDTFTIYNGGVGTTAAITGADANFNAVQCTVNANASEMYVNGTAYGLTPGTGTAAETVNVTIGGGGLGNAIHTAVEYGTYTGMSSGDKSAMNSNQHTVWGF